MAWFHNQSREQFRVALNLIKERLLALVSIMKISFHSCANKTNFHMKSFALSLALVMVEVQAIRKRPINFGQGYSKIIDSKGLTASLTLIVRL